MQPDDGTGSEPIDGYYGLLGQVVELGARLEFMTTVNLGWMVTRGDSALGVLMFGGESMSSILKKMKRLGDRFPDQAPGLSAWASQCEKAFEKRNRVIHDWYVEYGEPGQRAALRFIPKEMPVHIEGRFNAASEVRAALDALIKAEVDLTALMNELGDGATALDSSRDR